MNLITEPFHRWRDYSGRSRRREYWTYVFLTLAAMKLVSSAEDLFGLASLGSAGRIEGPLQAIVFLGLMIPGLPLAIRRLHDSGRAGWWALLPAAPVLVAIAGSIGGFDNEAVFGPVVASLIVAPLIFLVLMCIPGTRGANRFGPDPRPESLADIFA